MPRHTYQGFPSSTPPTGPGARELQRAWALDDAKKSQPKRAAALYLRAAELGQPSGMINFGNRLNAGDGVKCDPRAARRWYLRAWRASKDPVAAFNLAILYDRWTDTAPLGADRRRAMAWYRRASELGLLAAQRNLAYLLACGRPTRGELRESVAMLERFLAHGTARAGERWNLALALEHGEGVRRDVRRAMRLYRQAADAGDADAATAFAHNTLHGIGARANTKVALRWFRRGAARKDPSAAFSLGEVYASPDHGVHNLARARQWWRRAARLGHRIAAQRLRA